MKKGLRIWLGFVASLRLLSVIFGYLRPEMIEEGVFPIAKDQVTPLAARIFGIWTSLSCTVTLMSAIYIESRPLYWTTMTSFMIAILFFLLEVGVYQTVSLRSATAPGIIASFSVIFMAIAYPSISQVKRVGAKEKKA